MKKWICSLGVIIILVGLLAHSYKKYNQLLVDYKLSVENTKAFEAQFSDDTRVFKYTLAQLKQSKDSIVQKLVDTQKELGIKDKRLKQLEYKSSKVVKGDTIILRDTIFSKPDFKLDTIIGDKWVKTYLQMQYPNKVNVTLEVVLEEAIIISTKKETINPPKKFFIARWFQKKHIVVEVQSIERNPYVKDKVSKYIEIVK